MLKQILVSVLALCIVTGSCGEEQNDTDLDEIALLPRGIVGGSDAAIENHGYQVAILQRSQLHCGGSIISANWVLTAAHCCVEREGRYSISGLKASRIALRVGSSQYKTGGDLYFVDKILYNKNYNRRSTDYDVCVMKTTRPILYGKNVHAIRLPEEGEAYPIGIHATVSGWGKLSSHLKSGSELLQTVQVPVISEEQCRQSYRRMNLESQITERQICAGSPQGGMDACQGDSGGPMVVHGELVGVTSWGMGCGDPLFPGVYANVAVFRSWIRRTTGV